jgi:diadenosine tetraphosphate (Ap4A) HIT family hydrolase
MHFHVHVIPTEEGKRPSPPAPDASIDEDEIAAAAAELRDAS